MFSFGPSCAGVYTDMPGNRRPRQGCGEASTALTCRQDGKGLVLVKKILFATGKTKQTLKKIGHMFKLALSISGFVPGHATILRTVVMSFAFFFSIHLVNTEAMAATAAIWFYLLSTAAYIGFLYTVLPENGLRHWFMRTFGSRREGYLAYEAVLAFLFFVNGTSIGYVSKVFENTLPFDGNMATVRPVAFVLFVIGWGMKLWATKVVGVDIYYWKDMFYGKKISRFAAEGPYKFVNNPMYGPGQLQTYATALWFWSFQGLLAAALYQLAVFSFYHFQEKKFIRKVYLKKTCQQAA